MTFLLPCVETGISGTYAYSQSSVLNDIIQFFI